MPKRGSCGSVLPGCRLSKQYPSINSPAARCCTSRARRDAHCTLLGFPVGRDPRRLVLAPRLPSRAAPTCDPHSARCSAGCPTSRDFVPWRFLDAGQLSARVFHCCRRPKTSTKCEELNVRKSSPLCSVERTSMGRYVGFVGNSALEGRGNIDDDPARQSIRGCGGCFGRQHRGRSVQRNPRPAWIEDRAHYIAGAN
jgi:hypothetical protein